MTSTMTSKGQVTIPAEVRRAMDVDAGDKVLFELRSDGLITVRRSRYSTAASLAGAAGSLSGRPAPSDEELKEAAGREAAEVFRGKLASGDA